MDILFGYCHRRRIDFTGDTSAVVVQGTSVTLDPCPPSGWRKDSSAPPSGWEGPCRRRRIGTDTWARRDMRDSGSFGGTGTFDLSRTRTTDRRRMRAVDETRTLCQLRFGLPTTLSRCTRVRTSSRLYGWGTTELGETWNPWLFVPSLRFLPRTTTERPRGVVFVGPVVTTVVFRLSENTPFPIHGPL